MNCVALSARPEIDCCLTALRSGDEVRTYEGKKKKLTTAVYHYFRRCSAEDLESHSVSRVLARSDSLSDGNEDGRGEELSLGA